MEQLLESHISKKYQMFKNPSAYAFQITSLLKFQNLTTCCNM